MEAAIDVASNLLPDDRREIEAHGHDPEIVVPLASTIEGSIHFISPKNEVAGIAGVHPNGAIWMLCTPAIKESPRKFVRQAKEFVDSRAEPFLWNIVDKRNKTHLKLLKYLGFNFLREVNHGPYNLPFIEFCRVRSSNSGRSAIRE